MLSHRVNLKYYYFRLSLPIILLIMFSILKSSFGRPASIDSDQELTEDRGYPNKLLINNNNNNNQSKLFKFCCPNSGSQNIEYPDKHKLTIKRNKSNSNNSNMNKNNNDKNQFNNNTSNHVNNDKNKTIKVSSPTMTTSPDINNIPLPRQSSSNGNNNVVFEEQRSLSLTSESSLFSNSNIISNNIIMNETNEPILKHQSSINSITEDMDHDYVYNENLYEEDNNKHLLINDKENKSDNNKQQKVDHQIEHQIEHNIEGHIEQHQHFEEKHHRQEQMNHPKISKQCTKLSQSASISNKKKVQQKLMALQLPQINIDPFDDDYKQDPIIDDIDPFQDDFSSSFTRSRSNGLPNIDNNINNINNNNGDDYLGKYQPDDQSQNVNNNTPIHPSKQSKLSNIDSFKVKSSIFTTNYYSLLLFYYFIILIPFYIIYVILFLLFSILFGK